MYRKKYNIYRFWFHPQFQALTGKCRMCLPEDKGGPPYLSLPLPEQRLRNSCVHALQSNRFP